MASGIAYAEIHMARGIFKDAQIDSFCDHIGHVVCRILLPDSQQHQQSGIDFSDGRTRNRN
jgi:hypothetical protein